jgi:hypothetical protein
MVFVMDCRTVKITEMFRKNILLLRKNGLRQQKFNMLIKISKHFDISADYIMGNNEVFSESLLLIQDKFQCDFVVLLEGSKDLSTEKRNKLIKVIGLCIYMEK